MGLLAMRLRLTFEPPSSELLLPLHYNRLIQGLIYRSGDLASLLHDQGLPDPKNPKRQFKPFTFSRLFGRWHRRGQEIAFLGPVQLVIASPLEPLVRSLLHHFLKESIFRLGSQELRMLAIEVEPQRDLRPPLLVTTLSPITVYRTVVTPDGRRKTYYYAPFEREFEELLLENLLRKWRLFGAGAFSEEALRNMRIRPFRATPQDQHILEYKGTVIRAWTGVYELDLPPSLLKLAFDAGLGAKNAQGFGCLEIWQPQRRSRRERL